MAKHIVPRMGEVTYYIWPLMIPTPRWWDDRTGYDESKWNLTIDRVNRRLNLMRIIRNRKTLYN